MSRARVLALLACVSVLFHLKGVGSPPTDYHYHRQANTALIARNYARPGSHFLEPKVDWEGPYDGRSATELPLYMWMTGKLWPLFGLEHVWGRLLSILFSVLGAWYLFLFLRMRFDFAQSLASALLFTAIPLEIYFGRTIQPEALALAATLGSLYHWDRWLDDEKALDWAGAVFLAFLAIGHKLPYAYLLLALAFLTSTKKGLKAFARPSVLAAPLVCAAGVFAWYKYASGGSYVVPTKGDTFLTILDYSKGGSRLLYYFQFQFFSRLPELGATWPGMAMAAVGAMALWRRGERFVFLWWASVALSLMVGGGYTFFHEYTSLPMAPVMASFMGAGLVALWRISPRAKVFAAALVLAMPITALYRIKHWYNLSYTHLVTAQQAADAVSSPSDLFVCNDRAPSVTLFYLRRKGWCWGFNEAPTIVPRADGYAAEGAKFLMSASADLNAPERAELAARYPLIYEKAGIVIYRLSPAGSVAQSSRQKKRS